MKQTKRKVRAALRRAIRSCVAYNGEINLKRIAQRNKCSPKTVSRALRELQSDGIVSVERRTGRGLLVTVKDRPRPAGVAPTARSINGAFGWTGVIGIPVTVEFDIGPAPTGVVIDGISGGVMQTALGCDISCSDKRVIPNTRPHYFDCAGSVLAMLRGDSGEHDTVNCGIAETAALLPKHGDRHCDQCSVPDLSTLSADHHHGPLSAQQHDLPTTYSGQTTAQVSTLPNDAAFRGQTSDHQRLTARLNADHPDGTQSVVNPDFSSVSGEKPGHPVSDHHELVGAQNRVSRILDIESVNGRYVGFSKYIGIGNSDDFLQDNAYVRPTLRFAEQKTLINTEINARARDFGLRETQPCSTECVESNGVTMSAICPLDDPTPRENSPVTGEPAQVKPAVNSASESDTFLAEQLNLPITDSDLLGETKPRAKRTKAASKRDPVRLKEARKLIAIWCREFARIHRLKYPFNSRDAKAAYELVDLGWDAETVMRLAKEAWRNPKCPEWIKAKANTLYGLRRYWAEVVATNPAGKPDLDEHPELDGGANIVNKVIDF